MRRRRHLACALLAAWWTADLLASGAGLMGPFDPAPAVKDWVGSREIVRMRRLGELLVGDPDHDSIAQIIVHATSPPASASLVLWSRVEAGGSTMIRITAPRDLSSRASFVTLFLDLERAPKRVALAVDGEWLDLPLAQGSPVQLSLDPDGVIVRPVSLLGFGTLLLTDDGSESRLRAPSTDPGHLDEATRWVRAAWHLLIPGFALVLIRGASRRRHESTNKAWP